MRALARRIAGFRADRRGIAAIEFALILPILLTMYFGLIELTRIADTSRKLTTFARALADLTGRADNPSPSSDDMAKIASAASAILRPLNVTGLQIVVNAMGVENVGGIAGVGGTLYGGVCSSWTQNATKRPALQINGGNGLPATPAAYQFDGARYILAEVTMSYTPLVGTKLYTMLFGSRGLTFTRQIPWAERTTNEIVMPGGALCPDYG